MGSNYDIYEIKTSRAYININQKWIVSNTIAVFNNFD
jgi:hypothetical protein